DRRLLWEVAHAEPGALVHRQCCDVLAVQQDLPLVHAYEPRDHIEAGGFACSVGAQQTDDFATADEERSVLPYLAAAMRLCDPNRAKASSGCLRLSRTACRALGAHFDPPALRIREPLGVEAAITARGCPGFVDCPRSARKRPGRAGPARAG